MPTIQTTHVQEMIKEALDIAETLDGKPTDETVPFNVEHHHPPAMLLSLAINRLRHAAEELETSRLTCFGLPE